MDTGTLKGILGDKATSAGSAKPCHFIQEFIIQMVGQTPPHPAPYNSGKNMLTLHNCCSMGQGLEGQVTE